MADDDDTTAGTGDVTDDGDGGADGGDGDLGDAGKSALAKERGARKAAEARVAELEAKAAGSAKDDAGDGGTPDAAQIRRDAEAAATTKANGRMLAAEVRAAAAGKLADPSDAARYLDLAEFEVDADGSVDAEAISGAISDLIKRKPYLAAAKAGFQGSGDGGARTGGSRPKQLTGADLKTMKPDQIEQARLDGRLERYLSGG